MKKPMYFISLAGVNLHNVENIHDENGREISTYDGVGSGKFNVPDSKTPHSWKFDCELWQDGNLLNGMSTWSASELFKLFDSALESAEPSRFVVTSQFYPTVNFSTLAWVKRYTKDESYPGVYKTTIEVEEYKPVGVKTTDVPYVARPGKVPTPPKVITVKSSKDLYGAGTKKPPGPGEKGFIGPLQTNMNIKFADFKTGGPVVNPAAVKAGSQLITVGSTYAGKTSTVQTNYEYSNSWVGESFKSMGKAIGDWFGSQLDLDNSKSGQVTVRGSSYAGGTTGGR